MSLSEEEREEVRSIVREEFQNVEVTVESDHPEIVKKVETKTRRGERKVR